MSDEEWTYTKIAQLAQGDEGFRLGLRAAAAVCRAQGRGDHPCPSHMAAVYLDRLANGEMP